MEDNIVFRKVEKEDNMEDIARLLYDTDPYIYPYWFDGDAEEAAKVLAPKMLEDGFIFNYQNCRIAVDTDNGKIVAMLCSIGPDTNLEYDYRELASVNDNYKFIVDDYLKYLVNEVKEKQFVYLTNIAVDVDYREKKVGSRMLKDWVKLIDEAGYPEIGFDCLMHNLRAKNLYHSLGFKEVAEGIGFDGTIYSTVETVFFKRKTTPYTSEDFQMLSDTSVKETDLAREKYLYDSLNKKKEM